MNIAGSSNTQAFRNNERSFSEPTRPSGFLSLQMFPGTESFENFQNMLLVSESKLFQDAQKILEDYDQTDSLFSTTVDQSDSLKRITRTSTPQWKLDAFGIR